MQTRRSVRNSSKPSRCCRCGSTATLRARCALYACRTHTVSDQSEYADDSGTSLTGARLLIRSARLSWQRCGCGDGGCHECESVNSDEQEAGVRAGESRRAPSQVHSTFITILCTGCGLSRAGCLPLWRCTAAILRSFPGVLGTSLLFQVLVLNS